MALRGNIYVDTVDHGSKATLLSISGKGMLKSIHIQERSDYGECIYINIDGQGEVSLSPSVLRTYVANYADVTSTYTSAPTSSPFGNYNDYQDDGDYSISAIILNLPFTSSLTVSVYGTRTAIVNYVLEV